MSGDPFEGLLDREELLEGLPAKRADALLFLIESRTASLVARSRRAMESFLTEEAAQERELAFLEAFALGRHDPSGLGEPADDASPIECVHHLAYPVGNEDIRQDGQD